MKMALTDAIANGSPTYRWFRSADAMADPSDYTNTGQTGSGYRLAQLMMRAPISLPK